MPCFGVTEITEFQWNIFKGFADSGQFYGHTVRHAIAQRLTRSDAPHAALFVGLDAYRAAGGTTEDSLFEDEARGSGESGIADTLSSKRKW